MSADNRPPVPVPAATVILVREEAGHLQVYLLRRSQTSGFMPGSYVFPGGLVDDRDRDDALWRTHADLAPDALSERLGQAAGGFEDLVLWGGRGARDLRGGRGAVGAPQVAGARGFRAGL